MIKIYPEYENHVKPYPDSLTYLVCDIETNKQYYHLIKHSKGYDNDYNEIINIKNKEPIYTPIKFIDCYPPRESAYIKRYGGYVVNGKLEDLSIVNGKYEKAEKFEQKNYY